jgi:hypothetical protein
MKNIIIYTHMLEFTFLDGGMVVLHQFAKCLEEYGQNVRIIPCVGAKIENSIFSKYYDNEFPIDDNCVVVYCEGTVGNPLGAKYVVRWLLSKLGQNVPYNFVDKMGKNELVYYICSEEKIANNPEKIGSIYKFLHIFYIHPYAKNYNLGPRYGTCFSYRKAIVTHGKQPKNIHPPGSFEITKAHTPLDYIKIFNNKKFFISYDSITFLSVIAALCGCISIVKKVDGLSKEDWLNTIGASAVEYLKYSKEPGLYGIAYGGTDLDFATKTLHMAPDQWDRILKHSKDRYINNFVNDVNNWDLNINTIQNNFFL